MTRTGDPLIQTVAADAGTEFRRYANAFNIGHNAFEFVLEFGQQLSETDRVALHTSVVTLPVYARALSRALDESLARYEAQFGPIAPDRGHAELERGA